MKTTTIAAFLLIQLSGFGPALPAQDAGTAAPPLTYDYDAATPGVQGPKSPLVTGYSYRSLRPYQVAVPVIVPLADLQAILPPGFKALPTATNADFSTITMSFFLDQRFQPDASSPTTYGPTTAVLVSTTVLNTNLPTPRQELVFPCFEASDDIEQLNAAFGPGSARAAAVTASVTEEKGRLKFSFDFSDSANNFFLTVEAQAPSAINNRSLSDPVGLPFRTFEGMRANNAFWASSQSDTLVVPVASAKLKFHTPGHRLQFPAGALSILDFGPNITFSRGVEFILKFE